MFGVRLMMMVCFLFGRSGSLVVSRGLRCGVPVVRSQSRFVSDAERAALQSAHLKEVEGMHGVRVVVDGGLRSRLRLVKKHRRARVFVAEASSEAGLREAICKAIEPLRFADFEVRVLEETEDAVPLRVEVLGLENHKQGEKASVSSRASRVVDTTEKGPYQMLSFYAFFAEMLEEEFDENDKPTVKSTVAALTAAWENLDGVVGRAYVAPEGINAQLAVPTRAMAKFEESHENIFQTLRGSGLTLTQPGKPLLNLDVVVDREAWESRKPFKSLKVRRRDSVVVDGTDDDFQDLDLSDPGRDASPADWHQALGGDFDEEDQKSRPLVLDVRNHYESAVGTFVGATPLGTETFKETYEKLHELLKDVPRDQPLHMFCTGGIRCVKAGAYAKQKLGFTDVSRLAGGVVNYTRVMKNNAEKDFEKVSRFRGVNYVFNERMGEPVTTDSIVVAPKNDLLDARAAEALKLARDWQKKKTDDLSSKQEEEAEYYSDGTSSQVYEYAERLSGKEPDLMWRVRLDAMARYPDGASRMVCGPTQGRFLAMLASLAGAKRVLELGTFCGYSALWLAKGLGPAGQVLTVDRDARANALARRHFAEARDTEPSWAPIRLVEADTKDFLETLDDYEPFDFVYLDADKKGLRRAVDALFHARALKVGTVLVADNTLWKSKVLGVESAGASISQETYLQRQEAARNKARQQARRQGLNEHKAEKEALKALKTEKRDRELQQAMHEFNLQIRKDPRLDQVLLPLRDGLTIARVIALDDDDDDEKKNNPQQQQRPVAKHDATSSS